MRKIIILCSWIVTMFSSVVLIITGVVPLSLKGFSVDKNDRLYIGTEKGIAVYQGDVQVDSISLPTSRAYAFTMQRNDTILLSTATEVYILDLSGNVLNHRADAGSETFYKLRANRRDYKSWKGDHYHMNGSFGYTRIYKNNVELVYKSSPLSCIVVVFLIFGGVAMSSYILWNSIQRIKKHGIGFNPSEI